MDHELLRCAFSTAEMELATDARACVQAMLDFEAALARAQARVGLIPADAAEAIASACDARAYDLTRIAEETVKGGNPAIPLVKLLTARVDKSAAGFVHWGATSQDVVDSALMLVLARALPLVLRDLDALQRHCAQLADAHRNTVMPGRTLLQQALPITFGLKAAGWLSQLKRVRSELERAQKEALAVQFGGAVGSLASLGEQGVAVVRELALQLDLPEPDLPWHTARDRIVRVISALALVAGAVGKIAQDVVLMMQTEVAEVSEPAGAGQGGSSTMPHKRNPVASTLALASVRRLHALLPTVYAGLVQEHERAAGAWHAEWQTVTEALRLTAAALHHVGFAIGGLNVDSARMRRNLDLTRGLLMAEAVMMVLAPILGRGEAHARVEEACRRAVAQDMTLQDVLMSDEQLVAQLGRERLAALFDPAGYLGASAQFIDRALSD